MSLMRFGKNTPGRNLSHAMWRLHSRSTLRQIGLLQDRLLPFFFGAETAQKVLQPVPQVRSHAV